MRTEVLIESRPSTLLLTSAQADALTRAGQALASDRSWWGANDADPTRSVVECSRVRQELWRVTVRDAVGVLVVGEALQIHVNPKIPPDHFVYLAQLSGVVPRIDAGRGSARQGSSLWELVAEWFLIATERLIRRELLRDYEGTIDALTAHRGALLPHDTALAYYAGRPVLVCEFDEFSVDTSLNRLIKAAARIVSGSASLRLTLRRRAQRVVARLEDTTELRPGDERARPDRRTAHYSDSVDLARHILRHAGRSFESGGETIWTFLVRTPELVEQGLRCLLQERYGRETIQKRGLRLTGSTLTLNPDLVMEGDGHTEAVGDVKYKIATGEWKRADLYQTVTFATAFGVPQAVICEFRPPNTTHTTSLVIGDIRVSHIAWNADPELSPDAAAVQFLTDFDVWLHGFSQDVLSA